MHRHFLWLRAFSAPTCACGTVQASIVHARPHEAKIDTEQGKRIYARGLGIVEPVFANICVYKYMHRFALRSKCKVDVQWTRTRFALVHNIGKIHIFRVLPWSFQSSFSLKIRALSPANQ